MNEHEAEKALHTLYAKLETLRKLNPVDLLLSHHDKQYEATLEEAYTALARLETALDELGEKLEYQHARIGTVLEQS